MKPILVAGGAKSKTSVAKPEGSTGKLNSVAELVAHFDSVTDAYTRSLSAPPPQWVGGRSCTFSGGNSIVGMLEPKLLPPIPVDDDDLD